MPVSNIFWQLRHCLGNDELTLTRRLADPSTYACVGDNSCVYHMSNTAFPGLVGCCSGNDCGFSSTCYNSAKVAANPSVLSGNTAFALFCTESTAAECGTYTWGDADLTDFQCDSTAYLSNIYTKGTWGGTADGTILLATQYISTMGDEFMSTYLSSFDVSTSISKPNRQASLTGSTTATTTAAQPTTANSGNSGSPTSAGTIAGSAVGGVAGAGAIGAIAVFLLMRKKKKQRQQNRSKTLGQNVYQSAPEDQSGQSTWEIQQPFEVESHPASSLRKVQEGSPGSAPQEIDSKPFIAELPVPDDGRRHYK
ncbi:unnamed protein product [Penicillium egyptiacum]|uniref:Uncharacterized protein n=1 Tax=Penicillium egyptiacum TaxID=1303716 RepID=A0A9W4K7E1_9EURO|nr:unnamed protein product [Penicillium egyptiacum]